MNHRTKQNGWSDFELDARKRILDPLDLLEGRDYKHNYKMQNEEQTGYYEIDFFLFGLNAILEADGQAWHSEMGHGLEKDERRDTWFRKMGLETYRIKTKSEIEYTAAREWIKQLKWEQEVENCLT
jgi:very-short-patch-repair endonuclease